MPPRDLRLDRLEAADELLMPVALHVAGDEAAGRAGCIECVADLLVRPATIGTNVMPDWRTAAFSYLTTWFANRIIP